MKMQTIKFKSQHWINIEQPTEEILNVLEKKYKFHELDLEDLQESQRPKIDEYPKYLFIVLQFPVYNKAHRRYDTGQLHIFIGQNYLITVHNGKLKPLNAIFERCQKSLKERREYFGQSTGYLLYEILHALFEAIFPSTDKIELSLRQIEHDIFESRRHRDQLLEIMILKKNIIALRKIILPQRAVIAALEHKQKRFLPEDLVMYFDDIVDKIERLWGILEAQKESIESLEDTNESLLSHNINSTIRTLTVFSAIMLPLTFLTGLFGMNVRLPFNQSLESEGHFWGILISVVVLALAMFGVFKWKKWI